MTEVQEPQWVEVRGTLSRFTGRVVKVIVVLMVSIGLDVALTVGLVSAYSKLNETQAELKTTQDNQEQFLLDRCEAANDAANKQHQLWESVIAQSSAPTTPEGQARLAAFRKTLDEIYFQRDCSKELKESD